MQSKFVFAAALLAWPMSLSAQSQQEVLGYSPLENFVSGHAASQAGMSIEEFVPEGETVNDWSQMVTVQRMQNLPDHVTPAIFAEAFITRMLPAGCPGTQASTIETVDISGRSAAQFRADCPLNPQTGEPEVLFMTVIDGAPGLHMYQVAFRGAPTDEKVDWVRAQRDSLVVCTGESSDAACRRSD